MALRIVEKEKAEQADVLAIAAPLQQFNLENGPPPEYKAVVLTIENDEGTIVGGLFGKCAYRWMHVEFVIVPAEARGQGLGTSLMQQAESIAVAHGCIGVWLETLSFQALPFYQKLGYSLFADSGDQPPAARFYWLRKRLNPAS